MQVAIPDLEATAAPPRSVNTLTLAKRPTWSFRAEAGARRNRGSRFASAWRWVWSCRKTGSGRLRSGSRATIRTGLDDGVSRQ